MSGMDNKFYNCEQYTIKTIGGAEFKFTFPSFNSILNCFKALFVCFLKLFKNSGFDYLMDENIEVQNILMRQEFLRPR
ncbi:hypothetical protein O9G_002464 [Rozella allomycis CSF55]|uniref:Uncharacterized protein n=1 Tax=Rozella allomycis (strain CSF55) TaxID=988480 RepID=A0A075AUB9_ROZAC|nr:hypothetical protein O9G_002464 [Rozella allomycis CSF55]|eukprot:EPZ33901.1 hypothetical protein O9G_002464 [Rozella allomycis CSF55]